MKVEGKITTAGSGNPLTVRIPIRHVTAPGFAREAKDVAATVEVTIRGYLSGSIGAKADILPPDADSGKAGVA